MKNHVDFFDGDLSPVLGLIYFGRLVFGTPTQKTPQIPPCVKTRGKRHPKHFSTEQLELAEAHNAESARLWYLFRGESEHFHERLKLLGLIKKELASRVGA